MILNDRRRDFCPAGCGEKFKKKGVLGYRLIPNITGRKEYQEIDKSLFEYECPKCGMSYELDISELEGLGFDIEN